MAREFRYPTGARPLLIDETARRRRIEARFVSLLERDGFAEIVLPIIDFAEPYAEVTDRAAARQSYRFTDREGELVAVRSDFTPMVARALAPALDGVRLPLRVFYRGDVVRCEATRLGANRELFQIGAEVIGDASAQTDLEVLRLVAGIASAFCATPLVVYTSAALEPALARDPRFVHFAESDEESASYYTGLRFWVYGSDRRNPIAQGGRYDTLYARFGVDAAAIGFTFTVDDIGEMPADDIADVRSALPVENEENTLVLRER
ncbi:MAG TPA: ATP phosphoribosyltransferase regulatory subunit [Thermoanaerobaculia bacterium]|nr:ATP phosphoribosyltransferase regulatory subunit [Thermoanaerobaculia bacterium]